MGEAEEEKAAGLITRADLYRRGGEFRKMLAAGRELIALQPDRTMGYALAGQAHLCLNEWGPAEEHLKKALSFDPDDDFVHFLLAATFREGRRFAQAEEHIRKAIEIDPNDANHWCELAHLCHAQGDLDNARRYARKALDLDPGNVIAMNLVGMSARDDTPEGARTALKAYSKALEADPEDAYVHNNVGVARLQLEDYALAEESFRKALSLDPTEKIFRNNLYVVLKHRSILYRLLCLPGDLLLRLIGRMSERWWTIFLILLVPAVLLRGATGSRWIGAGTMMLVPVALFVVWFLVFKPLIRFYEFLILSDVKARAREVGARRGGPLGIHGWPFWLRFLLFFAVMCGAWTAIGFAAASPVLRHWVIGVVAAGVVVFLLSGWVLEWRGRRRDRQARERRSRFFSMERGR